MFEMEIQGLGMTGMSIGDIALRRTKQLKELRTAVRRKSKPCSGWIGGYEETIIQKDLPIVGKGTEFADVDFINKKECKIKYSVAKLDSEGREMRYNEQNEKLRGDFGLDYNIIHNHAGKMITVIDEEVEETIKKGAIKVLSIKRKKVDNDANGVNILYKREKLKELWVANPASYNLEALTVSNSKKSIFKQKTQDTVNDIPDSKKDLKSMFSANVIEKPSDN